MKTYSPKPHDIQRRWYVIDARGQVLGRLASQVAAILRGKHKPIFAPHMDTGDHVVVVNAREVVLTGGKEEKKVLHRHSGYPGGLRAISYARLLAQRPAVAVEKAVWGMLPKNRLGRQMFRKLAVYEGAEHRQQAQKPVPLAPGEFPKWEGLPARREPAPPPASRPKAAEEKPARTRRAPALRAGGKREPARRGTSRGAGRVGARSKGRAGSKAGTAEAKAARSPGKKAAGPPARRTRKKES